MARQTPREKPHSLAVQFYKRYVRFSEQLHNAWIYFEVQPEVLRLVEASCQNEEYKLKIQIASTSPINSEKRAPSHLRGGNLPGFITRNHRKEIPETALLNSVRNVDFINPKNGDTITLLHTHIMRPAEN